jgi:hypothetical protein
LSSEHRPPFGVQNLQPQHNVGTRGEEPIMWPAAIQRLVAAGEFVSPITGGSVSEVRRGN